MEKQIDPTLKDRRFMRRALLLARKGLGKSSPNPSVGALVVNNGEIVGQGFHAKAGTPHAEVHALAQAKELAKDATIYVTLEPCHHQGRTPPCTKAIMEAGIKKVVFGAKDPNPKVEGGGGKFLASQGLEVISGLLAEKCEYEHRFFIKHITTKRPYVILKTAATLDGKTASHTMDSRWVTGPKSREYVHKLRNWLDAICVGRNTYEQDNPSLTCRIEGGRDPLRVVLDTNLTIDPNAKVFDPKSDNKCLVATSDKASKEKISLLRDQGAIVLVLPLVEGKVDIRALLDHLGEMGITSLLLEGGSELAFSFIAEGLVDEVMYFFAPKIIGGKQAPSMVAGKGFDLMSQALLLERIKFHRFGPDIMLSAKVSKEQSS